LINEKVFSPSFYGRQIKLHDKQNSIHNNDEELTLELHKEELEVNKEIIETATVNVYKRTYTVEKQILVPVTYEELIIEKRSPNEEVETKCIPLSEERIEVTKHPIIFEDVEIYKEKIEEHMQINETVKEEKIHIDAVGDISIMGDNQTSTV
jgi:uncharacterized protein (TIGR02271 family)